MSCSDKNVPPPGRPAPRRGSVLITALLIAAGLAVGLVSYLQLSKTALKLSQRTLFVNDASNLAEAGLDEALYCFTRVNAGVEIKTAWSGWTLSGATARRTLPQFNRDQNGIGTVKVFVNGYDGSVANSYVLSQATITPFDGGAPVTKVLRLGMSKGSVFINGIVGLAGISLKGKPEIDSFNSNPTNSPTGPWRDYSAAISTSNALVVVKSGKLDLGNGTVKGNVGVGKGVVAPPASQVTGTITENYAAQFNMPTYPTAAGVSKSYNLGSKIPASLPVVGHTPAADGRYYYFVNDATIAKTTILTGTKVTIVGTETGISGITILGTGACEIYIDGAVEGGDKGSLNNNNWAGALKIFSTTRENCTISGNGELRASLFLPNAELKASGGGSSGSVVGSYVAETIKMSGQMSFHYDEALQYEGSAGGSASGSGWKAASWQELRPGSDYTELSALTGNFLP